MTRPTGDRSASWAQVVSHRDVAVWCARRADDFEAASWTVERHELVEGQRWRHRPRCPCRACRLLDARALRDAAVDNMAEADRFRELVAGCPIIPLRM